MRALLARHWKKLGVVAGLLLTPVVAHFGILGAAKLEPPAVQLPAEDARQLSPKLRRFGSSYAFQRGKLLEVRLAGTPEEIGYKHARLLYRRMVDNEGVLFGALEQQVPSRLARLLLLDLARLRYRSVDSRMSPERLREIAGGALGFQPDPYRELFPTYQRFVYLNALYDISLSFEESPLLGCTTLVTGKSSSQAHGPLLARAFDFEVNDIFDEQKAVFLVRENGKIPFASVAWPGLVGVVSGMNLHGLAVVVHGGRAGPVHAAGEPVVHALRRVLSTARSTREAIAALRAAEPMVSHIIVATDAEGHAVAIERIPGRDPYVRTLQERDAVTNHFEGFAAEDPKNQRVRASTSTLPRWRRAKQLISVSQPPIDAARMLRILRDRKSLNDKPLALGDRNAIDALIATHGVIMNTRERALWVSESPHLLGRFVRFDLTRMLADDYDPEHDVPLATLAEDPLLTSGEYARFKRQPPTQSASTVAK